MLPPECDECGEIGPCLCDVAKNTEEIVRARRQVRWWIYILQRLRTTNTPETIAQSNELRQYRESQNMLAKALSDQMKLQRWRRVSACEYCDGFRNCLCQCGSLANDIEAECFRDLLKIVKEGADEAKIIREALKRTQRSLLAKRYEGEDVW